MYIDRKFLSRGEKEGLAYGILHSVKSLQGHALMFEAYIPEQSANYDKVPIHALLWHEEGAFTYPLDALEIWDNPSYDIQVIEKRFMAGAEVEVFMKTKETVRGIYLFTIDFAHTDPNALRYDWSEWWPEHKSKNIIKLENGQLAAQPNNRIMMTDSSLSASDRPPIYLRTAPDTIYRVENHDKWMLGDEESFNYDTGSEEATN